MALLLRAASWHAAKRRSHIPLLTAAKVRREHPFSSFLCATPCAILSRAALGAAPSLTFACAALSSVLWVSRTAHRTFARQLPLLAVISVFPIISCGHSQARTLTRDSSLDPLCRRNTKHNEKGNTRCSWPPFAARAGTRRRVQREVDAALQRCVPRGRSPISASLLYSPYRPHSWRGNVDLGFGFVLLFCGKSSQKVPLVPPLLR